ncbi:hypothetical protein CCH79_00001954 [Gambusia affinis]|uniref:Uncharacterized protein n=1 Tax=Gambusia affinis TaxID=33528 RepID=A0A315VHU5_GAMAF|nr:hypothetical protein CCH79_00001954 [Gambusia affinis]
MIQGTSDRPSPWARSLSHEPEQMLVLPANHRRPAKAKANRERVLIRHMESRAYGALPPLRDHYWTVGGSIVSTKGAAWMSRFLGRLCCISHDRLGLRDLVSATKDV